MTQVRVAVLFLHAIADPVPTGFRAWIQRIPKSYPEGCHSALLPTPVLMPRPPGRACRCAYQHLYLAAQDTKPLPYPPLTPWARVLEAACWDSPALKTTIKHVTFGHQRRLYTCDPSRMLRKRPKIRCLQDPYDKRGFRRPRVSRHLKYAHLVSKIPFIIVASGAQGPPNT